MSHTIILRLSRELERKIRDRAIEEGISISDYIKKVCIYTPWDEEYEDDY